MDSLELAFKKYAAPLYADWEAYEREVESILRARDRFHEVPPYEAIFGPTLGFVKEDQCVKHLYPMGMDDFIWKSIDGEVKRCCIDCGEVLD